MLVLVAPLVGAWIEIGVGRTVERKDIVAPLVGAWIEMLAKIYLEEKDFGRSPCGSVD